MSHETQATDTSGTIEAALARAGLTAAADAGPLLIARGAPWRIVWANDAATQFLGTNELATLSRMLVSGAEPGARQLARQANRMTPGPDVADLTLRLRIAGRLAMATLSCRRLEGDVPLFAIAPWGFRPAAQISAAPSHEAAAPTTPEPAIQSPAATPVALSQPHLTDRRGNVRFLWRTNRKGELTDITGALCEAVGCEPAQLLGRDFSTSISELRLDPTHRLRDALARQETWSGIEVLWPVSGTSKAVPVVLGGLPGFDRARVFDGFSGFGVIHLDRVTDAPVAQPEPEAATTVASATHGTLADEIRADEAERAEADSQAASIDEAEFAAFPAHAANAGTGHDTQPAAPGEASANKETDTALARADEDFRLEADAGNADREMESQSLSEPPTETHASISTTADAPAEPNGANRNNVVPLRAWQKEAPKEQRAVLAVTETPNFVRTEIAPPAGARSDEKQSETGDAMGRADKAPAAEKLVGLSQAERNAFREIARALGARNAEKQSEDNTAAPERGEIQQTPVASEAPAATKEVPGKSAGPGAHTVAPAVSASVESGFVETTDSPAVLAASDVLSPATEDEPATAASLTVDAPDQKSHAKGNDDLVCLVDRLDSGVLVSRGGVAAYANRTLLDMLGHASVDDLHARGGVERMFRGRDPGALSRDADGGAIPVIAANGDVLALEVRVQSADWDGEPATLLTFRRTAGPELSARIRALELDLRQSEVEARETHAILDTATDGVVLIDEDGRILTLNKSAQALFGYEQNEVVGEPMTVLFARESHAPAMDYLAGLKSNGVMSVLNDGREIAGRASRGGAIPLFMTLGRVGSASPQRFCAVLRDLTQWKKVERELGEAKRDAERASQLKSDFLAKVSHEIRTPLNAILGFAEVIMDERFGPVGNERYKDYLKDIHSSGTHVLSLVNDLLDLSKIEAGKLDLNFGAVDANRIVNECVSLIQTQATRERVIIRLSLAPRLPNIVADERSLRQIVLNILSNAVKFNEPGGQVIVSTALTDAGHAVVRIRDTGIGMSDKELELALEPFRQIATSRQTTGTGLGLPLTKALVEANRASFTIKSRKGEGTLVEVAFPQTRVLAE